MRIALKRCIQKEQLCFLDLDILEFF